MNKIHSKGFAFEHEIAEKLKARNFTHVKVTKASGDYGADILAYKDGLEHVFQCKKYKGTVGFQGVKDVSTAMEVYGADKGVLVCDTQFSKAAYNAVKQIDKPIELVDLEKIKSWKLEKIKAPKYKPHSYQKKILTSLIKHRKKGNKSALLVLATGLGKTLVAAWDLRNQIKKGQKALFLVHRKDILVDNAEKFHLVINPKEEKFKFGIYYEGKKFDKHVDVVFSTFQTLRKHQKDIPKKYFDYIIIDEAHHSPAETYSELIAYFQPKFLLGITATPKRIAKQDNEFIESAFGKPLVDLDLAEALIKGYVSPVKYSVFCDNIDYGKLQAVKKKLSIDQLNRSYFIPTKDEDIEKIILVEQRKLKDPKTIIFCPSIRYINSVKSVGLFSDAEIYHSNMSDFDRQIIFRRFKLGKIRTLLVVDLFNEGIDIPDANLVVFLRTTYSPTIFFQQLGRGLRKAQGKKFLRVLDFVGALSKLKKVINVFGHLLIIQDFVEKTEKQKQFSNIYRGKTYKDNNLLDPLDLSFYQAGRKIEHKEAFFKRKSFLDEMRFLKKTLIKSEGWTEEEIIKELEPICKKIGRFPTIAYLKKISRQDLSSMVNVRGGSYYFAQKLGFTVKKKPPRYWKSWGNVKSELLPFCKKLGRMPSLNYLRSIGRNGLVEGILLWGGNFIVGQRLGYLTAQKPKGYWTTEKIRKELLPICKKLGKMPGHMYLLKIHKDALAAAIANQGGFFKIGKMLGYDTQLKPRNYWSWNKLKKELMPIYRKIKKIPQRHYLVEMGRPDLNTAIHRFGGYGSVARKLGLSLKIKPRNYWTLDRVKKELLPICEKLGKVPTREQLRKKAKSQLAGAIDRYGGLSNFSKQLGFEMGRKAPGYWEKWDNVKKALLPICKKYERLPTKVELQKLKLSGVNRYFQKNGGVSAIAKRLGFASAFKPKGYWNTWLNVEREILLVSKGLKKMPSNSTLLELGRSDLINTIRKWGGQHEVAKKLGLKKHGKPHGYWKSINNLKKELVPIYRKIGKMPTYEYLRKIKRSDLSSAIDKWGGTNRVAATFNLKAENRSKKYWTLENVKKELVPLIKKSEKRLTMEYIQRQKILGLSYAINKWGGITAVLKKCNLVM
ncbi:MAG: DEAD/DEAH box helicase family protein [Candidatus Omnitrophota bacterium]